MTIPTPPRARRDTPWGWVKTHPVALLGGASAVLATFTAEAAARHLLSSDALGWLGLIEACLLILGTVVAHGASTPIADPRGDNGEPLVPVSRPGGR